MKYISIIVALICAMSVFSQEPNWTTNNDYQKTTNNEQPWTY